MLVFCLGLALMIALWVRKVRGAILISILVTTVVAVVVEAIGELGAASVDNPTGWSLSVPTLSGDVVGLPSFDTLGDVDLFGAFGSAGTGVLAALLLVFSLLLADFFDTMGTMTAIGAEAGLNDEHGTPPNAQRILIVDSVAAIAGGAARRLVQHVLHRERLRRRRGRPDRPGLGRHRGAVPARHLLHATRRRHPVGGRRPGPGPGRLPDDAAGHRASTGATSRWPSRPSSPSC